MKDDTLILKATGIDAGAFLQDQLTCDMNALAAGRWTYAACCDPHGKVLAVLWVFPWADGVLLRLPRSAAPAFLAQTRENIDGREVQIAETPLHFGALAGDNPSTEQRLITAADKTLIGGVPGVIPFISEQPPCRKRSTSKPSAASAATKAATLATTPCANKKTTATSPPPAFPPLPAASARSTTPKTNTSAPCWTTVTARTKPSSRQSSKTAPSANRCTSPMMTKP